MRAGGSDRSRRIGVRSDEPELVLDDAATSDTEPTAATLGRAGLARLPPPAGCLRRAGRPRRRAAPALADVRRRAATSSGRAELDAPLAAKRQQLIRENGVTYNVYGDPRGMDRPWQLDPIPLLIAAGRVGSARSRPGAARPRCSNADPGRPVRAAAAAARAACCRRSWSSPTRLPAAVPRRAACRRAVTCTSTRPTSARAPDGRWWVLGDRTQAPSGAGYALENRLVLVAHAARCVPRLPRAAAGRVLPHAARHAARRSRRTTATTRASCC